MRVLFLENEDSFSWNLIDRLPFRRSEIEVVHGASFAQSFRGEFGADALVIGPGPRDPVRAGIVDLVRAAAGQRLPTLGVCLGHQALGMAFGAKLVRTPPMHGRTCGAQFSPSRSFPGFDGCERVMRYNSLALAGVAAPLRVVAIDEGGVVMAVEHEALPMAGVQFHPDSYATARGEELLAAFFRTVL